MAKRGRKSKLTKHVIKRISDHKGEGLTDRALTKVAGVGKTTWYEWLKKAATAKTGIYAELRNVLEEEEAALDIRLTNPLMKLVDDGNIEAIKTAMKKHPRLRTEWKDEPTEIKQEIKTDETDVINARVNDYLEELSKRGLSKPTKSTGSTNSSEVYSDNPQEPLHPDNTDT